MNSAYAVGNDVVDTMRITAKLRIVAGQLIIFAGISAVTCSSGLSFYCPLMGPDGQMVYATDVPWQTKIGVSKSECAFQCTFSYALSGGSGDICRCFNYNKTMANCSLFKKDPVKYAVDPFDVTNTYEISQQPLTVPWSTIPQEQCSFPFTNNGQLLYTCQDKVLTSINTYNDPYCQYDNSTWCFKDNRTSASCLQRNNRTRCPDGWNGPYNNSCYYVSPNSVSVKQEDARSACLGLGAELTSIVDQNELDYIANISLALTQQDYWVGLMKTSANISSPTYWLDYSLSMFRPWGVGDPNEATACIRLSSNGNSIRDRACSSLYGYICKNALGYTRSTITNVVLGDLVLSINQWIVTQNKLPIGNSSITFKEQKWDQYRNGFGDLTTTTNYWIGNTDINKLTRSAQYKLRVEVLYSDGRWFSAEYWSFSVDDESHKFKLSVSGFSGDADDALQLPQSTSTTNNDNMAAANGRMFSASDKDNDGVSTANCAQTQGGGWWYGSSCSVPILNVDDKASWYDGSSPPAVIVSRMMIKLAN